MLTIWSATLNLMISLFLPCFIRSAIFGIDYGSEYIKVSMALPGRGIHVVMNQQSKRLSPSYFAIWNISSPSNTHSGGKHWNITDLDDMDWAYLDQAKSHSLRFPSNAVKGMNPILTNRHGLKGQEILALVIRHLIQTVDEGKWKPSEANVVISVEPKLPREERLGIVEAMGLTNATLTAIVDSSTAAAHVYALEKLSFYDKNGKTVVFIDIGTTHTWIAVYNFSINPKDSLPIVDELAVDFNYTLGGNLMDTELANFLIEKFYEQHGVNVTSPRKKRQFLDEARRVKELLTLNNQVSVKIDDVVDDLGLNYQLTRDEFESLIVDFNQSLRELYTNVVQKAGLSISQIDSIELIGGITRVPFVKNALMEVSGMVKLNRTMNSDEVIALGAGYIGASRSTSFLIKKVQMRPFVGVNVSLAKNHEVIASLFNETSRTTSPSFYNSTVGDILNSTFSIRCQDVDILHFKFNEIPENVTQDMEVSMIFFIDDYSLPNLYYVIANHTIHLRPERIFAHWMMTASEFSESIRFIKRMDQITADRRLLQHVKNDFESYIYSIQDRMEYDQVFKKVLSDKDIQTLNVLISENREWLFNEQEPDSSRNVTVYQKKLSELQAITKDPEFRAEQIVKRAPSFMKLNQTLNKFHNALTHVWPETKPWLNETAQHFNCWLEYNVTLKWYHEKYEEQSKLTDTDNPIVKYQEIDQKKNHLEFVYSQTEKMTKPTPTPTPVPTSSEDVKSDADNVKNEQTPPTQTRNKKRIDDTGLENNEL